MLKDMSFKYEGKDAPQIQIELLLKILSLHLSLADLLCDKLAKDDVESKELFQSVLVGQENYLEQILNDIYARYGKIDPENLLP